jgi:Domain of unknown function (DUF4440)
MKIVASTAMLLLLIAGNVFAQSASDAAELTRLLNEFLAGASRNDVAIHERFWADDLIYTRSAGRRVNKADVMRDVRSTPAPKPTDPKTIYTAEDIRIQQYGDTAVVAFRLVASTDVNGQKQVANLLNSGTFVKRDRKWQVVNWQSTRMPRTEAESKAEVATAATNFHQAMLAANPDQINAITDQTFIWSGNTLQMTRQQLLDQIRLGKMKYVKPDEATSVTIYGDTALLRGKMLNAQYTLIFTNQLGVWRAVALHSN